MLKHPFKVSLFFGVPMLLIGIVLMFINPSAEGNLVNGFFTPIYAFEFIQSPLEVSNYFKVGNPIQYRNDMMLGNNIDFLFMFFYSAFLGFTGLGMLKESKEKILWIPITLTIFMFFADLLENMTIASIISNHFSDLEITSSYFGNLKFFAWIKWGSIATVLLIYGGYFFQRNIFAKTIGAIALINFVVAAIAFFNRSIFNEIMGNLTVLLFLLVFIHNVSFKKNKLA